MTIGWFPRYNPDGSRLTWERPGYWLAQWLTPDTEIAHNGANLVIGGVPSLHPSCNELSAGGGRWAGWRPDIGLFTSDGGAISIAGCPVVNPDGKFGYVDDRQADIKNLFFNAGWVARGAITDVRASRTALVWSQGGRTWGVRLDQPDTAKDIQAAPHEFRPIPIDTPDGPWVLNHTHTGLVLRPFGETRGYRFDNGGQTFYPDAMSTRGIVTIFTNDRGEQARQIFDVQAPRVPLGVVIQPKPPGPIHPEKPKEPTMSYVPSAPDIKELIRARAAKSPVEYEEARKAPGKERTDRFVRLVAADAHAVDPRFGLNGKRGTDELSLDVLAFKNPTVPASCGGVELRDFLSGDHVVVWGDATIVPGMRPDLPDGVKGKWIRPSSTQSEPPKVPGPTTPTAPTAPQHALAAILKRLAALEGPSQFAIKTHDGHYVTAENGGGGDINATRTEVKPWEIFTLERVK